MCKSSFLWNFPPSLKCCFLTGSHHLPTCPMQMAVPNSRHLPTTLGTIHPPQGGSSFFNTTVSKSFHFCLQQPSNMLVRSFLSLVTPPPFVVILWDSVISRSRKDSSFLQQDLTEYITRKQKCSGCWSHRDCENFFLPSNTLRFCSPVTMSVAWSQS